MILVDTNVILAVFIEGDQLQQKALDLLKTQDEADIKIIPEVWQEVVTVASVRHGSKVAEKIDEELKQLIWGWYEHKTDPNDIWINFWRPSSPHRMSFTDCTLAYLHQREDFEILTFDQELQKYLT